MRIFVAAAALLLASCGGDILDPDSIEVSGEPLQTFRNCRYEYKPAGMLPAMYAYRCMITTDCDRSEPCTPYVSFYFRECEVGSTTCEACPPGRLLC